jgi:small subunit ribosomal protein S9
VNGIEFRQYFQRTALILDVLKPLVLTKKEDKVDIVAEVMGGGKSGQAGALRHGIARALSLYEPDLRPMLKSAGLLTRDPRMVERKKYGLHKARKRYQYSKR